MTALKTGPLTRDDLREVWAGALDKAYREPFEHAGDGNGLEAHGQLWDQLARASRAIDVTTQAMFISPWSGQTNPPAAGEAKATVVLTFARSMRTEFPLVLKAGQVFAEEVQADYGAQGGVEVLTGRRYLISEDVVFHPGDMGPVSVEAIAEEPGYGYNNPLPGTIARVAQPGSGFLNDTATIVTTFNPPAIDAIRAKALVVTANRPDTFVPEHVGQYVLITGGVNNVGKIGRVVAFTPPTPLTIPPVGSVAELEFTQSFEATTYAGTFEAGEPIRLDTTGPTVLAYGIVTGERVAAGPTRKKVTFALTSSLAAGSYISPITATGLLSGATATIANFTYIPRFFLNDPSPTVSWRVLDWALDWGLSVTNALQPGGGRLGFLDELGNERNIHRSPDETDDVYRQRVKEIADVVSPNAIRRTLNRTLGSIPWCFREVGYPALPGFFYDGNNLPVGAAPPSNETDLATASQCDAYDTDVIRFTGVVTSGTFSGAPLVPENAEHVVLEDASNNVSVSGIFGRIDGGVTFTFVRKAGLLPASMTGLRIRGLFSGAIFTPASASIPATAYSRRFREYFDYTEFRAFFLVGLPRMGAGEFGFAYDGPMPYNAYDASPFDDFYDGSPIVASAIYRRVYDAIAAVKAGGVGFQLYLEDIGCP